MRRRTRRLVRPRVFNNARTASRNRDLAIRAPLSSPAASYCIGGFWPVHGGNNGRLSGQRRAFSMSGYKITWRRKRPTLVIERDGCASPKTEANWLSKAGGRLATKP